MTFGWLVGRYQETSEFASRKPATKTLYRGYFKWMVETWGMIPIKSIRAADIESIKLMLAETPSKANQTLSLFRLVLGYAERMEWVRRNVATRPGRLTPPKRHQVWEDADISRFLEAAEPRLRLGMGLMLHTAQRLADVLAMRAGQVTERAGRLWIGLKQQKTDALVNVPVHSRLEPLLRARLAEIKTLATLPPGKAGNGKPHVINDLLIPSPEGRLWQKRNFSRVWDEAMSRATDQLAGQLAEAGMTDAQIKTELENRHRERRDLRRTGIVRMAEAGATTPQIAAVSGHSIDSCQKILDVYLPRRSEIALGAILAWEKLAAEAA
jgi:integrase